MQMTRWVFHFPFRRWNDRAIIPSPILFGLSVFAELISVGCVQNAPAPSSPRPVEIHALRSDLSDPELKAMSMPCFFLSPKELQADQFHLLSVNCGCFGVVVDGLPFRVGSKLDVRGKSNVKVVLVAAATDSSDTKSFSAKIAASAENRNDVILELNARRTVHEEIRVTPSVLYIPTNSTAAPNRRFHCDVELTNRQKSPPRPPQFLDNPKLLSRFEFASPVSSQISSSGIWRHKYPLTIDVVADIPSSSPTRFQITGSDPLNMSCKSDLHIRFCRLDRLIGPTEVHVKRHA